MAPTVGHFVQPAASACPFHHQRGPLRLRHGKASSAAPAGLELLDSLLPGGGEYLDAAHIGLQYLRHVDGAVGQLVVLQHSHQGAAHGQA